MFRVPGFIKTVQIRSFFSTDMPKGKFFYAVRKGFKPGVYTSWDECKIQVDKFPAASFKKFGSEPDAWAFVRGEDPSAVPGDSNKKNVCSKLTESKFHRDRAIIYSTKPKSESQQKQQYLNGFLLDFINKPTPSTLNYHADTIQSAESDVSLLPKRGPEPLEYILLGQKRCHPKEGVECQPKRFKQERSSSSGPKDGFTYMGDAVVVYTDGCCSANGRVGARAGIGVFWGHNHPLNIAERLQGRQTNQRAEIQAACRALEQAKQNNIQKLVLYTDSKFTINGVTRWVKNWKLNSWRLKSGGSITNKDDFVKLDELNSELDVVWMHIPGHAGYHGNEEADRLSREGAARSLQNEES